MQMKSKTTLEKIYPGHRFELDGDVLTVVQLPYEILRLQDRFDDKVAVTQNGHSIRLLAHDLEVDEIIDYEPIVNLKAGTRFQVEGRHLHLVGKKAFTDDDYIYTVDYDRREIHRFAPTTLVRRVPG